MDIVHEYSCDSNSISFEEQTLNLQTESSWPIERSNNKENLQDDLDSTSTKTPSTKVTNFGVSRFEVPANAVTRKRSRRVLCKTKMDGNKISGTIKIKSINGTLKTINKEADNMVDEEVVKESCTSRNSAGKQGRPAKVKRIMNDQTSPNEFREGNNEFLAVVNKTSIINLTNDNDMSNDKKSALETETPESSIVVWNSNCTAAQVGNELQLNKENQEHFSVRSASHNEDQVVNSALEKLPFVKLSPLWETIMSSQLFLSMPQKPHFLPLKQYPESRREGMALGLMVTFSTVVMNTLKCRISDPGDGIEEMIDTLNDLERHGFELYNLRYVLEYFRYLRENHKRIINEIHPTKKLTSGGQSSEDSLNEKLEATDKTIMELEQPMIELKNIEKSLVEEKSVKPTLVEGFDCKINKLQNDEKTIENGYPAAETYLHCAREKYSINSIDLNVAINEFDLADTISTDDKREESKEERVNENKLSICEESSNRKERVLTFEEVSKYFYVPIKHSNLADTISTDGKREESKEERVNENKLSICEESGSKKERVLTFEQVSKYFYMPITQASKELNMGLTLLKKKCRELGIPRWPHRKMKSLQTLIKNVQETGREVVGEEELKNLEKLEQEKNLMEKEPAIKMEEKTKRLRQVFFKANYKKRRLHSRFVPEAAADHFNIQHIN